MTLPTYTAAQAAWQLTRGYWGGSSHSWSLNSAKTISYSFGSGMSSAEKTLATTALSEWSEITGIQFVLGSGTGQIRFQNSGSGASSWMTWSGSRLTSSTVTIAAAWTEKYGTSIGSYGYQTYLHEIGHALGLGHTGNYDGSARFSSDALYANDSWQTSVMSYFSQAENPNTTASYAYILTPMEFDIAAMRSLYGTVTSHGGNTTYGLGSTAGGALDYLAQTTINRSVAFTLTDTSGTDTIDFSHRTETSRIDLTPGAISDLFGRRGNMTIGADTLIENLRTGAGADTITGNSAANTIDAGAGHDLISGAAGNDTISGGAGNDTISGGEGNDTLTGGDGNDRMTGGAGADRFVFSWLFGTDTITDFGADDYIDLSRITAWSNWGEVMAMMVQSAAGITLVSYQGSLLLAGHTFGTLDATHFLLVSGAGVARDAAATARVMQGDAGNEQMRGSTGADRIIAGAGHDTVLAGAGDDTVEGGAGRDRVMLGAGDDLFEDDSADEIDVVAGGDGNDTITGYGGRDRFHGEGGNDSLTAGDDGSVLSGGSGDDTLTGGDGVDIVLDSGGNDLVSLGAGNDRYRGTGDSGPAGDTVTGGAGNDTIISSDGNDLLSGDDGNDIIVSGAGDDTVRAGAGNDRIHLGSGDDLFLDDADSGADRVFGEAGDDVLTSLGGRDTLVGGAGNDSLTAADAGGLLVAGSGDDTIVGGAGNDIATDRGGNDLISLGAGDDVCIVAGDGAQAADTINGGAGNDRIAAGAGSDLLSGDAGNDGLAGGAGNDTLAGGTGDDMLWGGAGADTFVFLAGDGSDILRDFTIGSDLIDLSAIAGLEDWADLQTHLLQRGAHALLSFDDLTITLAGLDANTLSGTDFLL